MSYYTSSFMVNYSTLLTDSYYLNPPNEGQSKLSIYAGKPVRFVARLVALVAIATIFAPIGACYNGVMALVDYPEGRVEQCKKHAYAALNDASYGHMALVSLAFSYFLSAHIFLGLTISIVFLPPALSSSSRIELLGRFLPDDHLLSPFSCDFYLERLKERSQT